MTGLAAGSDASSAVVADRTSLTVVEAFVAGKRPDRRSEDVLVIARHHAAVIDGMSSPLAVSASERSGRSFALAAAGAISDLPADATAREAVDAITRAQRGVEVPHDGPAGAVAAIYSAARREVWRVGDVHVLAGSVEHPGAKHVDAALAAFRAAVNACHAARGGDLALLREDPGLLAARPLLEAQPALANRADLAWGYGVLDGGHVPDVFIDVIEVTQGDVVLCTDGFLRPAPTLEAAELELARAVAVDPVGIGVLASMAIAVPLGQAVPDDRAYLRIATPRAPAPHSQRSRP